MMVRANRRDVLKVAAVGLLALVPATLRAQAPGKKAALNPAEEKSAAAVRAKAKETGIGALEVRTTEHFLGIGNGPAPYSARALELCEKIGKDYLAHFRKRGFKLDFPASRPAVVTLKDGASIVPSAATTPTRRTAGGTIPKTTGW